MSWLINFFIHWNRKSVWVLAVLPEPYLSCLFWWLMQMDVFWQGSGFWPQFCKMRWKNMNGPWPLISLADLPNISSSREEILSRVKAFWECFHCKSWMLSWNLGLSDSLGARPVICTLDRLVTGEESLYPYASSICLKTFGTACFSSGQRFVVASMLP